MGFWSGERLLSELPALISNFDSNRIDAASYRLTLGPEVYVTPTDDSKDWQKRRKIDLDHAGSECVIPPGQFAFLLTEETVKVPAYAIALISMRSRPKFRGLVNVSGFHVDPGYEGRLIFAVFNAGPTPIHVERGAEWFVIFYADLDRTSKVLRPPDSGFNRIPVDLINDVAGDIQSLQGLKNRIDTAADKLGDRISAVEREHAVIRWAAALIIGVLITLGVRNCSLTTSDRTLPDRSAAPVNATTR